jgi:cardiolipin synthase A/B
MRIPWKLAAALAAYGIVGAYYRLRPLPPGVNGTNRSYRVASDDLSFYHNTTWYEGDRRHNVRQVVDEVIATIRRARKFVVIDVFLFSLHHARKDHFVPMTRQIADAFAEKSHPCYVITDPINTSYGTAFCEPIAWLHAAGVDVCLTDLKKLRDNNLVYSPFWRLLLQWMGTGRPSWLPNPLQEGKKTTLRAVLAALNARGNHRKVIVADEAESHVTIITSANFEDSGSYFVETAVKIRSTAVARHFLEAEKAVARMSGCTIEVDLPEVPSDGDALVTPLMGDQIKRSILNDLRSAGRGDLVYVMTLYLSERDVIDAMVDASRRGAEMVVVLDQNLISFGEKKLGFPNQVVAAELERRSRIDVQWGNSGEDEFHPKQLLLVKNGRCIATIGSANFTRRSLCNTNLEASVRIDAPLEARFSQDVLHHARWVSESPRSVRDGEKAGGVFKYLWYRIQEAIGIATY